MFPFACLAELFCAQKMSLQIYIFSALPAIFNIFHIYTFMPFYWMLFNSQKYTPMEIIPPFTASSARNYTKKLSMLKQRIIIIFMYVLKQRKRIMSHGYIISSAPPSTHYALHVGWSFSRSNKVKSFLRPWNDFNKAIQISGNSHPHPAEM